MPWQKDSPFQMHPFGRFRTFKRMMSSFMFILFFGTRPGKKREAPLPGIPCPFCGQAGQLRATVVPQYIHLFWLPVYRLRPMAFVECGHCKKVYEGADLTPPMETALEEMP